MTSATAADIATVGIRTGLSHAGLAGAAAVAIAKAFDDRGLLTVIAAKLGW